MEDRPTAVVTGANRGIGRAIALELAREGYNIAGISRTLVSKDNKQGLKDLKPHVGNYGVSFLPLEGDIAIEADHKRFIQEIMESFGRIDVLVNNAGVAPQERLDILETTQKSYDRVMNINLKGPFFFTQKVVNSMIENMSKVNDYTPKVIFITSVSADVSSPNRAEYCISKSGLSMASRVFADRLAGTGINVYEIRPGIVKTDMTAPVQKKYDGMIDDGLIPQNRWGLPEDVAKAVSSIVDGHFDYSTGMIFEISGGMNINRL